MRFLVDECLSPSLAREAEASGFEAYHMAHIGRAGSSDREIVTYAISRDMVLVTNNASDFRRLYSAQEVHPGLVILVPSAERETQRLLFRAALGRLRAMGELVNKALEVSIEAGNIGFDEYELPR